MFSKRFLGVGLLVPLAAVSMAAITMTVNVKEGQSIAGDFTFEVRVQSQALVSSVEFYLNDDLRDTDDSTPYQFTVDTITEKEGKAKVTFAAYNTAGESVKQTINIVIDNELGKGVAYHVEQSNEFNRDGKFREAIQAARKALKIDKSNNDARMAMARANYGAKVFDVAQKFAEDVAISDPSNSDAKALLAAINLRRAFNATGSNAADTNKIIGDALKAAAAAQSEILRAQAEAVKEPTSGSLVPWIDAQLRANRFTAVASKLRPMFEKNIDDPVLANRFIYALINSGRIDEAIKAVNNVDRYGSPDGYSYALKAVAMQMIGNTAASEAAEKEVLLQEPTGSLTKYLQAYLSIARGRMGTLAGFVRELENSQPNVTDLSYYKSTAGFVNGDFDDSITSFQTGLLANPASTHLLVERGNQILQSIFSSNLSGTDVKDRAMLARSYFDAALVVQPDSFAALNAVAIANLIAGETKDSLSYAKAAVAAGPGYPAAYYTLAAALRQAQVEAAQDSRRRDEANQYRAQSAEALAKATELDQRLKNRMAPSGQAAWSYQYGEGRLPLLPFPPAE